MLREKEGLDTEENEVLNRKKLMELFRPPTRAERAYEAELERLEREEFVRRLKEDMKKKD